MVKYTADKKVIRFRLPQDLWKAYKQRVEEFGFKSNVEVISCLIDSLRRKKNGLPVSRAAEKIFSYIPESCRYSPWKRMRTTQRMFYLDKEIASWVISFYPNCISILFNKLIEAFLAADVSTIRSLRRKIHKPYAYSPISKSVSIYVSYDQFDHLLGMARNAGLKIPQLIRLVMSVFYENEESNRAPEAISSVFAGVMQMEGITLKKLKNDVSITVKILDDAQRDMMKIFMSRYSIPGVREMLRRLVLFLLYSYELPTSFIPQSTPEGNKAEDCWDEYFDENETYWNIRASRKEFVSSLYR